MMIEIASVLEKIMKIIEQERWKVRCNACSGEPKVGEKLVALEPPIPILLFLCLSCAQEAGRLAELEQARERAE